MAKLSFSLQVLDWIENHGEAFLSKHTGVGKSLHRARALQKRHEDFEEVAQVRQWLSLFSPVNTCVLGFESVVTTAEESSPWLHVCEGDSEEMMLRFQRVPGQRRQKMMQSVDPFENCDVLETEKHLECSATFMVPSVCSLSCESSVHTQRVMGLAFL